MPGPKRTRKPAATRTPALTEAGWQAMLDTARDAIISIDEHGRITLFNRCAEDIFGYAADEMLGQEIGLLMPMPYAGEHPDYLKAYQSTGIAKAIGSIRAVHARRKSGEMFPIELSVSDASVGARPAYLAIVRDVSERQATEEALRRERDFAARLIETAQAIVLILDPQGRIVRFNPFMEQISGYALADVQGKDWFTTFLPEHDRERVRATFAGATGGTPVRGYSNPIVTRDGVLREIEWSGNSLTDAHGEVIGVLSIGQDVTERRRAQRRQGAQYTVTRVLAAAASLSTAIPTVLRSICEAVGWEMGEFWRVDAGAGVLRWFGLWHAPELNLGDFAAASRQTTLPSGRGLPGRVWANGEPEWVADVATELHVSRAPVAQRFGLRVAFGFPIRSKREVVGVMAFFSRDERPPDSSLLQMLDALGEQIGAFVERTRAADALRESEHRFAQFMRYLPGVAFMKDPLGRYVYVNHAFEQLLDRSLHEVAGRTDTEVWPGEVGAALMLNDRRVLETREALLTTERVPSAGEPREWLVSKFPILDVEGTPVMVAGVAVDITEQRRAEAELRALQKVAQQRERLADIGAITAEIVHDLGNPLAALSMQVQLILRRARRDETQPVSTILKAVEQIMTEVRRLSSWIAVFMGFSREQRLDLREMALRRFLQDVVDSWRPLAAARDIEVRLEGGEDAPSIRGDADKLRRVFDNLVKNALEAIDPGPGRVAIQVSLPSPEKVRVSVEDSGSGIAEGMEVFRLFETTKVNGSGLGLAIARQIVLAHGGSIEFAHAEPHGTVFHVDLPRTGPTL